MRGRSDYLVVAFWTVFAIVFCQGLAGAGEPALRPKMVMVPMRDGIRLKTAIFSEPGDNGRLPVVLLRTPYNQEKGSFSEQARRFAKAGYVAVTQDCRGRFGSEGSFVFYWGEGPDGFDTVAWLRAQPWCDGRIAMWGASYMGSVQWLTAAEGTPLTASAPTASASNFYYNLYLGGAFMLPNARAGFSMDLFGPPTKIGSSPEWPHWFMHLPLTDWDKLLDRDLPWQMSMIRHYRPDGFWKRANAFPDIPRMDFPGQHIVGYYDFMCRDSVRSYQAMCKQSASAHSRAHQQLILGPWDHGTGQRRVAEIDFGPTAQLDVVDENIEWFDRWLKEKKLPPYASVRYFSMGNNRWYEAAAWPPPEANPVRFYLHSAGQANTRRGDGTLDHTVPGEDEATDTFRADPADPVPTVPALGKSYRDVWGPVDQQLAQDRPDVLVYMTPKLTHSLRLAGQPRAELWVSADTPDADWVVKVIDVRPDGYCHPLATGIRRGSARESELDRTPLVPGKKYLIRVDLGHTAARLATGHRLAVQIAGSSFPIYERNTNTGEGPTGVRTLVATEKVYHDAEHASRVILPVVE